MSPREVAARRRRRAASLANSALYAATASCVFALLPLGTLGLILSVASAASSIVVGVVGTVWLATAGRVADEDSATAHERVALRLSRRARVQGLAGAGVGLVVLIYFAIFLVVPHL